MLTERKRFNVGACGRRMGKTEFALLELFANRVLDGVPCGWFAPNYKYLEEPWRRFLSVMAPVIKSHNQQTRRIELITGAICDFWTLDDEDAGRSRKYGLVIIDEAGLVKNLERRWFDAIRPTLSDLEGEAWMFGTPKGKNFFWTAYSYGQDPLNKEWASWQMPTSTNPYIKASEIEAARLGMPERSFEQEYLAVFHDDAGGVFRGVSASVDHGVTVRESGGPFSIGVDLARVEDFTVISVVDATGRQCYFERFNQISWERQIARIMEVHALYRGPVWIDSTGVGDPIFERLRQLGIQPNGFVFTNSSKEALIDNLAMRIEQGDARLLDVPVQTSELQAYQYELTPSRNVRMNAPEGMHDDTVIALALAYWGINKRRTLEFF